MRGPPRLPGVLQAYALWVAGGARGTARSEPQEDLASRPVLPAARPLLREVKLLTSRGW